MIPLIKNSDRFVLSKTDGIKNAVYYLDMLAFYDAYSAFVGYGVGNLPNYCMIHGKIYLDGLCLLIKNYSSKFGFATLDLTMNYLKYLYFSIAKYSKNEFLPERDTIVEEFKLRTDASREVLQKTIKSVENAKFGLDNANSKYIVANSSNEKDLNKSKKITKISFILILVALACIGLFVGLYFAKAYSLLIFIMLIIVSLGTATTLVILLQRKAKNLKSKIQEFSIELNKLKKDKDEKLENFNNLSAKNDKITVDVNSYIHCFKVANKQPVVVSDEFIYSAIDFNMLSYNIEYDVSETFSEHSKEILQTVKSINALDKNNLENGLSKIYGEIQEKDYLKYNTYVRYSFIDKFIDFAEENHIWKINYSENLVSPFGVDIKNIAGQRVTFLKDKASHFIELPAVRLLQSKLVQSDENLDILNLANGEDIREKKLAFIEKFYNANEIRELGDSLFVSENEKKQPPVDLNLIEGKNEIPNLISIKFKLMQAKFKIENSNHKFLTEILPRLIENPDIASEDEVVKQEIASFGGDFEDIDLSGYVKMDMIAESNGIEQTEETASSVEDLGDGKVKYTTSDGEVIIGNKF